VKNHEQVLENIYHRGQERVWNGREILEELIEKYGMPNKVEYSKRQSLKRIFMMILQGEEAAWHVSLQLGTMLKSIPAKMAATSQAHDEARHFYVLRDYLEMYECTSVPLPKPVIKALTMVKNTNDLAKKLLGMQLMVEPIALTIFHEIRKKEIEPILTNLMPYYEKDEARHVALGVYYLPQIIKDMNRVEIVSLMMWQLRLFMLELKGLAALKKDFEVLGISPNELFALAEKKQLEALEEVSEQMGWGANVWKPLRGILRYQKNKILG